MVGPALGSSGYLPRVSSLQLEILDVSVGIKMTMGVGIM
jgi:hypothetical protein